jgi:hypothetical protein
MNPPISQPARDSVRDVVRAGAVLLVALLLFTVTGAMRGVDPNAFAAVQGLDLKINFQSNPALPIVSTGSATRFVFVLPANAKCSGDSATQGFRVRSYMVRLPKDLTTLQFDASGPVPSLLGANLSQPLWNQGTPLVEANTAVGTGALFQIPDFDFGLYTINEAPAGDYAIGLACTTAAGVLDNFFNANITLTASASDPGGFTWGPTVAGGGGGTTTTAQATTTTAQATTTTAQATTTTAQATTTTAQATTTTAQATTTTAQATTTTAQATTTTTAQATTTTARPTTTTSVRPTTTVKGDDDHHDRPEKPRKCEKATSKGRGKCEKSGPSWFFRPLAALQARGLS